MYNVLTTEGGLIRQVPSKKQIHKPNKKLPFGKPRQRWMAQVNDDFKKLRNSMSIEDAEDREGWKAWRGVAKPLNGARSNNKS